jgi:cold shock protein
LVPWGYEAGLLVQRFHGARISQNEGIDGFVHPGEIPGEGFRTLEEGQEVEFEMGAGATGLQTQDVMQLYEP